MKKHIRDTTLVCIDCKSYGLAVSAIKKSMIQNTFERVIFLTDIEIDIEGVEVIQIESISSKREYSKFVMFELYKYIQTDYMLIIQGDGYILNGELWDDEWFKYDYIGARWLETDDFTVGNGGFSFRSRRLMALVGDLDYRGIYHPEDSVICRIYRPLFEGGFNILYAPNEVADRFSYECVRPTQKTFGFHNYFWDEYKETICVKRMGALGDVIQTEPIMRYYHNKGYAVSLQTNPEFYELFRKHDYPIIPYEELGEGLVYKEIDLDMTYESMPQKNHISAYNEFCGIKDNPYIRPQLKFNITAKNRLFSKYVVIHIDDREQPYRNINILAYRIIVNELLSLGYIVIQVGKNHHYEIQGAIQMNTASLNMLQYLIAGSDMFIGVDSAPSHIAVAHNIPSIIFFGSVNPELIHLDKKDLYAITREGVCETPFCWHDVIGTTGKECVIDRDVPPCTMYLHETERIIKIIEKITSINKST